MGTVCQRIAILMALFISLNTAAAGEKKEHPVMTGIPGFTLVDVQQKDFASHRFGYEKGDEWIEKEIKGKYGFYYFEYKKGDREFSELEIAENYKAAVMEKGGQSYDASSSESVLILSLPNNRELWTHLRTWTNSYELFIVEQKAFKKRLTLGSEEMKKQLDVQGSVSLYGIYFDLDKSTLKPGSEKVLAELVKLLRDYSELSVEIQGHTDSTGSREHNLPLSRQRAATVKAFLELYGIQSSRMTISGFGPDKPVASNKTAEGKALNRRVELKKR